MRRSFLVTGARGFVGTAFRQYLTWHKDISVTGITRTGGKGCLKVDLLDHARVKKFLALRKPDVIFHLAGGRVGGPHQMLASNVLTTFHLCDAIHSIPDYHPRVIVIGSAAEYGAVSPALKLITEKSPANPSDLYGWIKLLGTQMALHYARLGVNIVTARLFNILGPGTPEHTACGKFALEITAREGKHPKHFINVNDLRAVRDFLDIRDICEALYMLSVKGRKGEIYNICSQKGIVMRDLLQGMIRASRDPLMGVKEKKGSGFGVLYSVGSCVKFKKLTGWRPQYDLHASMMDTLDFYRHKDG